MNDLVGRIALVTGAGAGIGRAVAMTLAERGASVALHYYRSREGAQEAAREICARGRKAVIIGGDLTQHGEAARVVTEAHERLGPIDILVNNAGDLVERQPLANMSETLWRRVFDLNVTSTFFCTQAVAAEMMTRRTGAIVNLSSLAAHNGGGPGAFAYATAKAAVIGFTKGVAKELAPHGVRINAVAPALIGQTAFHGRFTPEETFKAIEKTIPLGRAGTPEEVARVVAFLASDESSYLTGETIDITGGMWFR